MKDDNFDVAPHLARMIADPVYFCEVLGILHPHDYQKDILRSALHYDRILVNTSRQIGKCCLPTTKLQLSDGRLLEYKDFTNESVMMYTGDGFKPSQPVTLIDNGLKECMRVITRSGRIIECTINHPFLTQFGYINVEDLTDEHRLAMVRKVFIEGKEILTDDEVAFTAYMIADGTIINRKGGFAFFNGDKDIAKGFISTIKSYSITKHGERCPRYNVHGSEKRDLIEKLGLMGTKSGNKFIPQEIFQSTTKQISIFISKLIDCDGYIRQQKNGAVYIEYCSKSEQLIRDLGYLTTRLGMYGRIFSKYNKKVDTSYWHIQFTSSFDINNAKKHLILCPRKQKILDQANPQGRDHIDTFPFSKQIKQQIKDNDENVIDYTRLWEFDIKNYYSISPEKVHIINEKSPQYGLDTSIFWDKIETIKSIGKHQTLGLEVPEYHNHITDGFVTHNTTSCGALSIWWTLTKPLLPKNQKGGRPHLVTMVAPTEDLVRKLFQPTLYMVESNPFLKKMLKRATRREIEWWNGSIIRCTTAGEKGKQLRGDPNDLVIFDEAAHVEATSQDLIFGALEPSLAATRGSLYLISTPNGRSNHFGKLVLDSIDDTPELGYHYIEVPCWIAAKAIRKDSGLTQLDEATLLREKKRMGDILFGQEYECKLIDVGLAFFDWELVQSCVVDIKDDDNNPLLKIPESEIFFGIDVARSIDKTVIVVAERFKEPHSDAILMDYMDTRMTDEDRERYKNLFKMFIRYIHVINEPLKFFSGEGIDQELVIRELYKKWQPRRVYMDSTGLGIGMFEYLARQGYPVEGITFSQNKKKELFDSLKNLMRTGRVSYSKTNNELHNQLNGITVEKTIAGTEVLRHSTRFDDIACALALVTECTRTLGSEIVLDFAETKFGVDLPDKGYYKRQEVSIAKPQPAQWDW